MHPSVRFNVFPGYFGSRPSNSWLLSIYIYTLTIHMAHASSFGSNFGNGQAESGLGRRASNDAIRLIVLEYDLHVPTMGNDETSSQLCACLVRFAVDCAISAADHMSGQTKQLSPVPNYTSANI